MTIKIINYNGFWRIESNFIIDNWDFLHRLWGTREIQFRDNYSYVIRSTDLLKESDIEEFLDEYFTNNPPISIQHNIAVSNTLQELNSILRRLEREVNPSFIQHIKTLLGLL